MAEVGFAILGEDLGDGALVASFDLAVEIEEAPAEALGEESAGGGFSGAHEAGEDDAIEGVAFGDGMVRGGFGFGGHGLGWGGEGCCTHCRLRKGFGETKFVAGKRKTADLVGCGSVDDLGSLFRGDQRSAQCRRAAGDTSSSR